MGLGPLPDQVRNRVAELCAQHRVSFAELSRLLGREDRYVDRFIREARPYELTVAERDRVARYFGLDGPYLGAPQRPKRAPYRRRSGGGERNICG